MTTQREEITTLSTLIGQLPDKDQGFARSLCDQGARKALSEKQMYWVRKLTAQARHEDRKPERPQIDLGGSLAPMLTMFQLAATHLKYPKVRLQTSTGRKLFLAVAGQKSKFPGTVNVTDQGGFENRTWFGRVSKDGVFEAARPAQDVIDTLHDFAKDPVQAATAYGRLTGECCFCGKQLTDDRSVAVGYGATCADHYGLPWGAAAAKTAA